jgi:hypothetical protein
MGKMESEGGIATCFGDLYPLLVPESREATALLTVA